jgi:hypothetical protein
MAPLRLVRSTYRFAPAPVAGPDHQTSAPRRPDQTTFRGRRATGQPSADRTTLRGPMIFPITPTIQFNQFQRGHLIISVRSGPVASDHAPPHCSGSVLPPAGLLRHGRGHAAPGPGRRLAASRRRGFSTVRVPREASPHLQLQVRARAGPHPPPGSLPAAVHAGPTARCSICCLHGCTMPSRSTGTRGCRLQPAVGGCRLLNSHELLLVSGRIITTGPSG